MEGRNIGTVVFPDADPAVRARRRFDQMEGRSLEHVEENIRARDKADAECEVLHKADDLNISPKLFR